MGGGASTAAMKRHTAAGLRFIAGETAALTFADDLDRVRARGVEIVADVEAERMARGAEGMTLVRSGDLDPGGLRTALRALGVNTAFDAVAVAVQDHGYSPDGSNRVFRFALWERAVRERRPIGDLFYSDDGRAVGADPPARGGRALPPSSPTARRCWPPTPGRPRSTAHCPTASTMRCS